jgi:hypothetical protein
LPDALSIAIRRQLCATMSLAELIPDLSTSPVVTVGLPLAATAVVT